MRKSLVANSLYNILYKIISVLYPLVAVTYVSHILMAERMGMVAYAQNIVSYFAVIAALGIPTYGIREIAVRAESIERRSDTFWELFIVNGVSTSLALIVYIILSSFIVLVLIFTLIMFIVYKYIMKYFSFKTWWNDLLSAVSSVTAGASASAACSSTCSVAAAVVSSGVAAFLS